MSETTTTDLHHEYLQRRTFGGLDGLRALSILAVLWHHAYEAPTGWAATERGFLGVDLFFVISGFLIVSLLLRERARRGDISLRNFYIRRFLRIFPLYYGVLGALSVLFLVVGARVNMRDAFFHDLPWALTYTSNWAELSTFLAITWSLSAEEQFYIVWPPLERLGGRAVIAVLWVALLLGQVLHFGGFDGLLTSWGVAPEEPKMLRQTGFTPMLLGVLLAHALHTPQWWSRLAPLLRWRPLPVVVVVGLVGVCSLPIADITGWPRLTVHLLMVVLVGSCVVREDHALRPLLSSTPLVKVGVLSYGIYLLHMPVRIVMDAVLRKANLLAPTSLFVSTVVVTLVVAQLSYTLFESRFLKLKDRFNA
jgi:peptidoglycan/LPS O-acetylase OafA/YrhL